MISHLLIQDAYIVNTTTDKHGDQKQSSLTAIKCKFRYNTIMDKNVYREGLDASDAIVWLADDVSVSEGTIIKIDSDYWRVDRLIKAKNMKSTDVQFNKAFVNKHKI